MFVNVYKGKQINSQDSQNPSFMLDNVNNEDKSLILLYIYFLPDFAQHGFKVGMTKCSRGKTFWQAIKSRISQQENELALPDEDYIKYGLNREVVYWGVCLDARNESFKDYYVHKKIIEEYAGLTEQNQEWFLGLPLDKLITAFDECRLRGQKSIYTPRKEQQECVDSLSAYFSKHPNKGRFLLNCKMRFGKCYATYKYCEENNINKILILTFVPAVEQSWRDDLNHIKKDYDYYTDEDLQKPNFDLKNKTEPFVLFLSLQNFLGKDIYTDDVKQKMRQLQKVNFDLLVLDEYHFGAWNARTQETLEDFDSDYAKKLKDLDVDYIEKQFKISVNKTICLSGTPFKALARKEFNDSNTFTYTYFDEQKNKYPNSKNDDFEAVDSAYEHFPDMRIFGYNMSNWFNFPGVLISGNRKGKRNFFSLNQFFKTERDNDSNKEDKFVYENCVKRWLHYLSGAEYYPDTDFPYVGSEENPDKIADNRHSLWLMPTISDCAAMAELLKNDNYFKRYQIINLSQQSAGTGKKALDYLKKEINEAENRGKLGSIAITVNKLTMGVTVPPWSAIFVLKDLNSAESYFQAIFRIQTPYVKDKQILKKYGYVYDFNIDRAADLMLQFAKQAEGAGTKRLEIAKLIVKYMPIYMNGRMDKKIGFETFVKLAELGDTSGKSLSSRIRDTTVTTRVLDDDTIAAMLNDPDISDIIKRVFAHARFNKPKTKTYPNTPQEGYTTPAYKKGYKDGLQIGEKEFGNYLNLDNVETQKEYNDACLKHEEENMDSSYSKDERAWYANGFKKGYEHGVDIPIKKLQSGKEDGVKFAKKLQSKYGANYYYEGKNKKNIANETNEYLNDINNIPVQFRGMLYQKWYKESFAKAVKNYLRVPKTNETTNSIEEATNVIQHLLSRLFQFLYISVYRETTFDEIFNNADPDVFLEAVGITKKEFETLNKYNVFQKKVLDSYIEEFFYNEELGKSGADKDEKDYRNSFGWFGFSTLSENQKKTAEEMVRASREAAIADNLQSGEELVRQIKEYGVESAKNEAETPAAINNICVITEKDIPSDLTTKIEKGVYAAIYTLSAANCDAKIHIGMIKNYLNGKSPQYKEMPYYKSFENLSRGSVKQVVKKMIKMKKLISKKEGGNIYYSLNK